MLPKKLKDFNLFGNGHNWKGQISQVTTPELGRNLVDYRGAGMDGPVGIDMGQKAIELGWTCPGLLVEAYDNYGAPQHDADQLRFVGFYESDETGEKISAEITVRGRTATHGSVTAQSGEDADQEVTTRCSYYKLEVNGEEIIEIDFPGCIFKVRGVDRYAERRRILGL
tara:strand:+ start:1294 stop:1800 length:507 start_codon:yes stop_codon:yes gene_type:complete